MTAEGANPITQKRICQQAHVLHLKQDGHETSLGSNYSDEVPRTAMADTIAYCEEQAGISVAVNTVDHGTFQDQLNSYLQATPDDIFTWFAGFRMRFFADQGLATLAGAYQPLPEACLSVALDGKKRPSDEQLAAIRVEAEKELEGNGLVVVRPSGTEPVIRVMVQHDALRTAKSLAQQLADKISAL